MNWKSHEGKGEKSREGWERMERREKDALLWEFSTWKLHPWLTHDPPSTHDQFRHVLIKSNIPLQHFLSSSLCVSLSRFSPGTIRVREIHVVNDRKRETKKRKTEKPERNRERKRREAIESRIERSSKLMSGSIATSLVRSFVHLSISVLGHWEGKLKEIRSKARVSEQGNEV